MDRTQYETVQQADAFPTTVSVAEVGTTERTLAYGYHLNGGGTFHVYVLAGLLHAYTYRVEMNKGVENVSNIRHISGEVLDAEDLRPTKRAYPERTDAHFAMLMKQRDAALTFTTFNDEVYEQTKGLSFHGEVFETREAFL